MKQQREDDPAAKRAFRRMAILAVALILGGILLVFLWMKDSAVNTGQGPSICPRLLHDTAQAVA
ncbi:hypothetical protein H4CHR_05715 [Variovorax sp. PBS-H4]|uniref:hypothetical protein n=1 Tax=Variovorax sp. PBS-H4 TaxID=434008 RepID=UPI00131950A1|nr:hypothetical protein [Variovorax sp. PBS-H4]VTU40982.1 hypothetical protein H4CHR_05715 [Variovorax sp. PBS-H4]